MTPRHRKLYSFWIDPDQATALKAVKERDGVPESEQIRRAINAWLRAKRIKRKARPRRAARRRKGQPRASGRGDARLQFLGRPKITLEPESVHGSIAEVLP